MGSLRLSIPFIATFIMLCSCQSEKNTVQRPPAPNVQSEEFTPSQLTTASPRGVLEAFVKARLHGAWSEAFKLTDTTDNERSYYVEAERKAPLAALLGRASTFEITSLIVNGSHADAVVSVSMPDLTPFIQKLLMMGVKANMLGEPESYEPILVELKDALDKEDYRLVTQIQRFQLIESAGVWKVRTKKDSTHQ